MNNNMAGMAKLISMVRASRDLWFLNDAAELSEKLYKELSGKALTSEAKRLSKIGSPEDKRKSQLAYEFRLAHQLPGTIEGLIKTEGAYICLASDLAHVGMHYRDCVQDPSLLVPKEMDRAVFERFANSYDNVLFYDLPYVAIIHDRGDCCAINRIHDKTKGVGARNSRTTIVEGAFDISPSSQAFEGSVDDAVELVKAEQEIPNLIITSDVGLGFYIFGLLVVGLGIFNQSSWPGCYWEALRRK